MRAALVFLAVALAGLAVASTWDPAQFTEVRYRLEAPSSPELENWLERAEADYKTMDGITRMFMSDQLLRKFRKAGFHAQTMEVAQPLTERMPEQLAKFVAEDKVALPAGYIDFDDIVAFLDNAARTYPNLASVVDTTSFGPGTSYEGRALPLLKISNNVTAEEDEPAILINGMHHAREVVTPVIVMDIATRLLEGYSTNSEIRNIVDGNAIYLAPVWNPDGYVYVWTSDNMWRKNRKPNSGGSYGVDLNRNYDLGWDNTCSGSSVPASETYKGPSPASEEETQIMTDISLQLNLAKMLDFHSSGREVLVSYLCEDIDRSLDEYIKDEGARLGDLANYGTRDPSADGEHQEWTIARVTSYAYLVETATEFQPDYDEAVSEAARVWPLVQSFLEQPAPISGHVTVGGAPAKAKILIEDWDIEWHSEGQFGRYHIFLPNGAFNVTFVADDSSVSYDLTIDNSSPRIFDVEL